MADSFSKEKRSEIMGAVKSSGNKSTELKFITIMRRLEIKGWRRSYRLFGNPDFVFPTRKIALFTDGCFWHGHNCRNTKPKTNAEYWKKKTKRNKQRDNIVSATLTKKGWKVLRIWECKIKNQVLPKEIELALTIPN